MHSIKEGVSVGEPLGSGAADPSVSSIIAVGREPTTDAHVLSVPVDDEENAPIYIYFGLTRKCVNEAIAQNKHALITSASDSCRATVRTILT